MANIGLGLLFLFHAHSPAADPENYERGGGGGALDRIMQILAVSVCVGLLKDLLEKVGRAHQTAKEDYQFHLSFVSWPTVHHSLNLNQDTRKIRPGRTRNVSNSTAIELTAGEWTDDQMAMATTVNPHSVLHVELSMIKSSQK